MQTKLLKLLSQKKTFTGVRQEQWGNGILKSKIHYKNGKKEGRETIWYESGEKKSESHWRNGIQNGLKFEWREDGVKWKLSLIHI